MYPGDPRQQPPHTQPQNGGYGPPQQPERSPNAAMWLAVLFGAAAFAMLVALIVVVSSGDDSSATAAEQTRWTTATETITRISTTTDTTTTTRTTTVREGARTTQPPARTTQPQQTAQWPSPPYSAPSGFEWARLGPYASTWTCGQASDSWPAGKSECFIGPDGQAYYYGLRQASR